MMSQARPRLTVGLMFFDAILKSAERRPRRNHR